MTVRNTFVTVADGDQLNQGYFNGIPVPYTKSLTDSTEYTATSATYALKTSLSFGASGDFVTGVAFEFQSKLSTATDYSYIDVRFYDGSSEYVLEPVNLEPGATSQYNGLIWRSSAILGHFARTDAAAYTVIGASPVINRALSGAGAIRFYLKSDGTRTAYLDEVIVTVFFIRNYKTEA